jgi:hypothetical protein
MKNVGKNATTVDKYMSLNYLKEKGALVSAAAGETRQLSCISSRAPVGKDDHTSCQRV